MSARDRLRRLPRSALDAMARRPSLAVVALVVTTGAFLVVAPPAGSTTTRILLGLVLVVLALGSLVVMANLAGADPDAEQRAGLAVDDPASIALLGRWLRRSRHFRFVGGLAGFLLQFGVADNGPSPAGLAIGILGGIAAGGALAEVHSWRRRTGPRVADLRSRRLRSYVRPIDLAALALIALVAAGLALRGALDGSATIAPPLAALAVVLTVAAMLRSIVLRPRPALDPGLHRADELMRRLAATQGFTRPAIAVAAILVAVALDRAGAGNGIVVAAWLVALAWYLASRQSGGNLRRAATLR